MTIRATEKSLDKSCPPKLRALLRKVDFSYQRAANYCGVSKSYLANVARGTNNASPGFLVTIEKGLARAMNGEKEPPPPVGLGAGKVSLALPDIAPDKGALGLAFVFADQAKLPAIFDAGTSIGGAWVYRRRIAGGRWVLVLKLADKAKLATFKTLAGLVAEVVTP